VQEIISVAIGRYIYMIDMSKAVQLASAGGLNAEHPVLCGLRSPLNRKESLWLHNMMNWTQSKTPHISG